MPSDFTAIDAYYRRANQKKLADYWGALDLVDIDVGAQMMSVEYRNRVYYPLGSSSIPWHEDYPEDRD